MERWLGASVVQVPNTRTQSTVPIGEYNRSIERHFTCFTDTLEPFLLTGLNTEAELILARAGKFETYFISILMLSCTLVYACAALHYRSHQVGKNKKIHLFSNRLIYQ